MADARAEILSQIRKQLGRAATPEPFAMAREYEAIPRGYKQMGGLEQKARTLLLLERLLDYDAEIHETSEGSIAATVAEVLTRHGETVLLAPDAVPSEWLPSGVEVMRDHENAALSIEALTSAGAVLTRCAGAIAETGTLLLTHANGEGRRVLTLLPDHHICVLRVEQIVETVSEGLAIIANHNTAAITTISGPSATADIEMTRIRGVHGPRRLTVLLLH